MNPKITIGITCFNAGDTIAEAIESALKQTYENIEIVVVDDCSSDNSVALIGNAVALSNRVRLIQHKTNSGVAAARNTIIQNGGGEYIAFFDDDDISVPDRLEKQYQRIKAHQEKTGTDFILCYSDRSIAMLGDKEPSGYRHSVGRVAPEPSGTVVAGYLLWNSGSLGYVWGMMGTGVLMMRRDLFNRIGLFDVDFRRCEDLDLAIRASYLGAHFISVAEPLIFQRETLTADKAGRKQLHYNLMLRRKHKEYLKGQGVYWSSFMNARARFFGSIGQVWTARFYKLLACLLAPRKVISNRFFRAS